ncbi:MAG: hypothetical protein JO059_22260, partial [Mycobacterium sp.]|nr:hypothetical protein [Mycobacterium sp.]
MSSSYDIVIDTVGGQTLERSYLAGTTAGAPAGGRAIPSSSCGSDD